MHVPANTLVVVADGEKLELFRAEAPDGDHTSLKALKDPSLEDGTFGGGSGGIHGSSPGNPDPKQDDEDRFASATVDFLNKLSFGNKVEHIVVIAAPKMLGVMRKHYHKALEAKIVKEIDKEMTGESAEAIAAALDKA